MKTLVRNPFVYMSIFLFTLLVFQIAQIVRGQTGGTWAPPTAAPPGGQPEAPLDTGTSPQGKKGSLSIGTKPMDINSDKITIEASTGEIIFDRSETNLSTKKAAITLRQDPPRSGNWVLQATHNTLDPNGWFTIGAGTGAGGGSSNLVAGTGIRLTPRADGSGKVEINNVWQETGSNIRYPGKVFVGDFVVWGDDSLTVQKEGSVGSAIHARGPIGVRAFGNSSGYDFQGMNSDGRSWFAGIVGIGSEPSANGSQLQISTKGTAKTASLGLITDFADAYIRLSRDGRSLSLGRTILLTNTGKVAGIPARPFSGSPQFRDILTINDYGDVAIDGNMNFGPNGSIRFLPLNALDQPRPPCNPNTKGMLWYSRNTTSDFKDILAVCIAWDSGTKFRWRDIMSGND